MLRYAVYLLLPFLLAACANTGLRDLQTDSAGPDEFRINPVKALEEPGNYSTLPEPTPGQGNRTDRSATNEGIVAFGGRPQNANAPVPASDGALVRHASRNGVDPNIRTDLAETDAKFRKRKARLTQYRIVPVDRYNQAYKRQALDAAAELRRWRKAGARTPTAPPPRKRRF